MASKKSNKQILSDEAIQENVAHQLMGFEADLRELFAQWINKLSKEEVIAHIEWVTSEDGREFLEQNGHLVASSMFDYMDWADQRFDDDFTNADGDWDLADSLSATLEEEVEVQN